LFSHLGHKSAVVDFQWNPIDPWTFCTVSDEGGSGVPPGGGTLQLWRVADLVWKNPLNPKWKAQVENARKKAHQIRIQLQSEGLVSVGNSAASTPTKQKKGVSLTLLQG